jgi:hypothetical protein
MMKTQKNSSLASYSSSLFSTLANSTLLAEVWCGRKSI